MSDRYFWVRWTPCLLAVTALIMAGCGIDRQPIVEPDAGSAQEPVEGASGSGTSDDGAADAGSEAGEGVGGMDTGQVDGGDSTMDASQLPSEDAAAADGSGSDMDASQRPLDAEATEPDATGSGGSDTSALDTGGSADAGGAPSDAGDAAVEPEPTFGLVCGQVTCPAVPAEVDQCCTSADDVTEHRAREPGRCGVDLTARGGAACMQLEQPGVVDPACPAATPSGALSEEPGCCSDEGHCGIFNAAEGIGCHYDGEPGEACSDVDPTVGCEPTGTFALRAEVDVSWGGRRGGILFDLTEPGRGDIVVLLLVTIDEVDESGEFLAGLKVCRAELPPFYSATLCEAYQAVFPDAIWDSELNLPLPVTGRYQCLNPGCFVTFDPYTALVGIELDDPDGAWPAPDEALDVECSLGEGEDCYPDVDGDGHPGATVTVLTEGQTSAETGCSGEYDFRAPPLSSSIAAVFERVRRADRLHLGVRMRLGGSGSLGENCEFERASGVADFVQSRAASCMVEEGTRAWGDEPAGPNEPCSNEEVGFMNDNLPIYDLLGVGEEPPQRDLDDDAPSEGPSFQVVRLGDADAPMTCTDVRELAFP